jgi:hypothetical protein
MPDPSAENPNAPRVLAAADQELAYITEAVDRLTETWTLRQALYDANGYDRLQRIIAFMHTEIAPASHALGIALTTVAIEKLAKATT